MSRVEDEDEVKDDDDDDDDDCDDEWPNNQHQLTGTGAKYHQH